MNEKIKLARKALAGLSMSRQEAAVEIYSRLVKSSESYKPNLTDRNEMTNLQNLEAAGLIEFNPGSWARDEEESIRVIVK